MSASAGDLSHAAVRRIPFRLVLIFAVLLAADQLSKLLVRSRMHPLETIELFSIFKLQYVRNRGIAFGLLDGYASIIIPVGIVIIAVIVVATLLMRDQQQMQWPLAMLLAGAVGNLVDRVFLGSVTDFIRLPHWPAFNLADIFIVLGVVLLVYQLFLRGEADAREG